MTRVLLPLATAALAVAIAVILQPITDRAWSPLMLPAVIVCTWYGGAPAGGVALAAGLAGRMAFIAPAPWTRPVWSGIWLLLHVAAIVAVGYLRRERRERDHARRVAREQADRALRANAARRAAFLSHASEVLASSADYETTLSAVANLAVPQIADLCVVDMVEPDGSFRALAVAHVDPQKAQLVRELRRMYPLDPKAPLGPPRVLRLGQSIVYSDLAEEVIEPGTVDAPEVRVARALGLRSAMAIPLLIGGRRLGVISFATAESGRRFVDADLHFAEDLARRAAIAIDAARP